MPIVTTGLTHYWNPKQGLSGSTVANIAPGGPTSNMTVNGAIAQANGALRTDGVDDTLTVPAPLAQYGTVGQPFTLEILFTPRSLNATDHAIFVGSTFIGSFTWGDLYFEIDNGTTYNAGQMTTVSVMNQNTNPVLLTLVYNGSVVNGYINGVNQNLNISGANLRLAGSSYPTIVLFGDPGLKHYATDFHAMRFYTRALTTSEITSNYDNGIDVGLGVVDTRVKIMELRMQANGKVVSIPVYSAASNPTGALRISTAEGLGAISLVPTTDAKASPIRIMTPNGVRALQLE